MKKIYVSPSDQVNNIYAYGNTNEAVVCREVARKLCAALERCGFETKTDFADGSNAMYNRCRQSDAWGADMHIPIHTNACNGKVTGTRVFSYNLTGESYKASVCVFNALAPVTPGTSENVSAQPQLYEIRVPKAVSVYVEIDFHDVPKIAKWLIENTEASAEAICKGICNYYGVAYVEKNVEPEPQPVPTPKPSANLVIQDIPTKKVVLTRDANLWNLDFTTWGDAKAVKTYAKGEIIEVTAIASHPLGSKYYMTEYSYSNKINNGFNTVDCADYVDPIEEVAKEIVSKLKAEGFTKAQLPQITQKINQLM